MKQVIAVKLEPSQEQYQALLKTVEAFNRGCQYAADVAYQKRLANKIALQPFVYGTLRSEYGLPAQLAIRAISKAVEAYKRDKRVHVQVDPHGAVVYDPRIMSFKGLTLVSLMGLNGRELVPMRYGAYQAARLDRAKGQADLILRDGTFYLYVTVDLPSAPPIDPQDVLGVDLGIVQLAVDSDGQAHTGDGVKRCRHKFQRLRRGLQKAGTKSAKRHLRKARRRESRYQRDVNHCISKHLVSKALAGQKALAIEELRGIRDRMRAMVQKTQRYERLSWAFAQLRAFLRYKCEAAGIPLIVVDPRNTSRTCVVCGHCAKENRRSQSEFLCRQCGFQDNADFVGSVNIRRKGLEARAAVIPPTVSAVAFV
ncbi:MAG: transposase [Armatimonadetes bacterium]|nr:transposase [Armatimonadota bacterium]